MILAFFGCPALRRAGRSADRSKLSSSVAEDSTDVRSTPTSCQSPREADRPRGRRLRTLDPQGRTDRYRPRAEVTAFPKMVYGFRDARLKIVAQRDRLSSSSVDHGLAIMSAPSAPGAGTWPGGEGFSVSARQRPSSPVAGRPVGRSKPTVTLAIVRVLSNAISPSFRSKRARPTYNLRR